MGHRPAVNLHEIFTRLVRRSESQVGGRDLRQAIGSGINFGAAIYKRQANSWTLPITYYYLKAPSAASLPFPNNSLSPLPSLKHQRLRGRGHFEVRALGWLINKQQYSAFMEIQVPQLLAGKQGRKYRKHPPNRIIKTTFCMLLFVAFAVYRFTFFLPNTACIADAYHNFTITLNRDLVTEAGPAFEGNSNQLSLFGRAFIGMGQVLMDLWIAIMAVVWLLKTHNLRAMAGIALFYLIRGTIFLNLMKFPYPPNLAWRSPGFFSATVPYDHTRDFFFSGHCGGLSVVICEMFALGLVKTGMLSFVSLLYMANMLMATEVHYSIDIIAGILFGIFFFRIGTKYTSFFDRALSLPLVGWQKLVQCVGRDDDETEAETVISQGTSNGQGEKEKPESNQALVNPSVNVEVLNEEHSED